MEEDDISDEESDSESSDSEHSDDNMDRDHDDDSATNNEDPSETPTLLSTNSETAPPTQSSSESQPSRGQESNTVPTTITPSGSQRQGRTKNLPSQPTQRSDAKRRKKTVRIISVATFKRRAKEMKRRLHEKRRTSRDDSISTEENVRKNPMRVRIEYLVLMDPTSEAKSESGLNP